MQTLAKTGGLTATSTNNGQLRQAGFDGNKIICSFKINCSLADASCLKKVFQFFIPPERKPAER